MWRIHEEYTSSDQRLRVSLTTPVEEPWADFLDVRRVYEKNGEVLYTKRGVRVPITTDRLEELKDAIRIIGKGERSTSETAGLRLLRRANALYIRKMPPQESESEEKTQVFLALNPKEAGFLLYALSMLKNNMIARGEAEGDECEKEDEVMEAWF